MKKLFTLFFFFIFCVCTAQINKPKSDIEIIKVKKFNIEKEIKNGSLTFLKGCFWTETVHVGKRTISTTRATPDVLIGRRGVILIEKIKKKNSDGSFTALPSKQLLIE